MALTELGKVREDFIAYLLQSELEELHSIQKNLSSALEKEELVTREIQREKENGGSLSFSQKLADKVATFGGSWTFIITFMSFLAVWIMANAFLLKQPTFDPYPFILLNLILSCIAALQAPIIMMSQNRLEEKDRERAKMDYIVNLKAELEIKMLHEKMDHLMTRQQQQLLEIQKLQVEMMEDVIRLLYNRQKE